MGMALRVTPLPLLGRSPISSSFSLSPPPSPVRVPVPVPVADISANTIVHVPAQPQPQIDKLSYRTVDALIKQIYNDPNTVRSTALDILAMYLKAQKILYTESKTFCERRLNALMLPAILTTAVCSIVSLQLKNYEYGAMIVSILNGLNSLLLALVSYLKLDAKAEAHRVSAYKYDKLQAFCEFKSGKILFLNDEKDNVVEIIDQVETQVREIKETNQFLMPERVRYTFRETFGGNVFTRVKEIQVRETILVNQLKGQINALLTMHADPRHLSEDVLDAESRQNQILEDIIMLRRAYLGIDEVFEREIERHIKQTRSRFNCLRLLNI
jgi:hypothetical protein